MGGPLMQIEGGGYGGHHYDKTSEYSDIGFTNVVIIKINR